MCPRLANYQVVTFLCYFCPLVCCLLVWKQILDILFASNTKITKLFSCLEGSNWLMPTNANCLKEVSLQNTLHFVISWLALEVDFIIWVSLSFCQIKETYSVALQNFVQSQWCFLTCSSVPRLSSQWLDSGKEHCIGDTTCRWDLPFPSAETGNSSDFRNFQILRIFAQSLLAEHS